MEMRLLGLPTVVKTNILICGLWDKKKRLSNNMEKGGYFLFELLLLFEINRFFLTHSGGLGGLTMDHCAKFHSGVWVFNFNILLNKHN